MNLSFATIAAGNPWPRSRPCSALEPGANLQLINTHTRCRGPCPLIRRRPTPSYCVLLKRDKLATDRGSRRDWSRSAVAADSRLRGPPKAAPTSRPAAARFAGLAAGYVLETSFWQSGEALPAVRAATINNVREFKMESQLGSIEPGKIANLVLMKKSPLKSVDAYASITTVWVHGKAVPRDGLAVNSNR